MWRIACCGKYACCGEYGSSPGSAGNFGLGVLARGLCLEAGPSLVFLIQILSDGGHLPAFEFGHLDRPPALGGADHGAEHQLEHGLLAKGVGDDLQAPALLDEQTLEEVRRPDRPAVGDRHPQMRDAGLEVVREAAHGSGQLGREVGDDAGREIAGDGTRRRLVAWVARALNSGHRSSGTLAARLRMRWARQRGRSERGKQVSSALTIPGAPSETTSSGSPRPRARMSWKNAVTVSASSLEPAIRCSRTLAPLEVCPQAASTGARRCPGRSRSAIPSTNR